MGVMNRFSLEFPGRENPPTLPLSPLAKRVDFATWGQAGPAGPMKVAALSLHLDQSFKSRFHHLPP